MEPTALETVEVAQEDTLLKGIASDSDQGETEDEEVKRNCTMGLSELRDSDFSDADEDDDVNDDEIRDDDEPKYDDEAVQEEGEQQALLHFAPSGQMMSQPQGMFLYRPTPIATTPPTHREEIDCKGHPNIDPEEL
jgi:hypothetical protein